MEQNAPAPTLWTPRRVALATVTVLLVAFGFYILVSFRLVFFLLFTAIVLSTALNPLVDLLSRWKVPRTISVVIIALLLLALVIAFLIVLSPIIIEQSATLATLLGDWYQDFNRSLLQSPSLLVRRFARQMPPALPLTLTPPTGQQVDSLQMIEQAITFGGAILRNILVVAATAMLAGVWILEGERISRILMLALPISSREPVRDFLNEASVKVGAYTRGLAILTSIVGGLSIVAYMIIGLPNVLLLGLLAGIFELVPLVGPLLGAIPALLVAASTSPDKVLSVIIATVIIQTLENNLIVPKVMDRTVGVNPIASFLAFLTFGSLFGFVGALLAVPLAAVIQIILNRLLFEARPGEQTPLTRRDAVSMLRYEAQDLVQDVRKQVRDKDTELEAGADQVEDSVESVVQDLDSILAEVERKNDGANQGGGNEVPPHRR